MRQTLSRRTFGRVASYLLGSAALPNAHAGAEGLAPARKPDLKERKFPDGFLWGSATASYQVEGAANEDGRGQSIWDTFAHRPGNVANGDTGDTADDYYHRFKQDIALMKRMGLKSYRFSVAWTRIFPAGTGAANDKGVDFYSRVVDDLLAAGIAPYCTLYHWDLPQTLQDKGGWENRDTAKAFGDYAGYVAGKLSDRVHHFMTMNEIRSFVELGYSTGIHAPGLKLDAARVAQLTHFALLGHGLAVQAIRAVVKPETEVGLADNVDAATPVIDSPEHIEAARRAMREQNAMYLTAILEGHYTDAYLKRLGPAAPHFTADEMKTVSTPLDFVGLNIYAPIYVRASDSELGYETVTPPSSFPHMLSPWLYMGPEALYWAPRLVTDLWKVKSLYITENGASSHDVPDANGEIVDTDRVMYLRNYLTQLQRATSEGLPVKGYFLWSLLDNFEWADGYEKRFGVVYVDFKTQKRTPKFSAKLYEEVIRTNALA